MSGNPILQWFKKDKQLCDIVNRIDATGKSVEDKAIEAFHQLSEHFDLPKYRADFTEKHEQYYEKKGIDDPRSVSQEASILQYLMPDDDLRGIVMLALHNVKHGKFTDMNECALRHFGSVPKEYMVCYFENPFPGRLHFLQPGESWFDLGAVAAAKIING